MMVPERIVHVLGGPGAGKGTQCKLVHEKLGWAHISISDLLRREVESGSALAEQIKEAMAQGELVATEVVIDLLAKAVQSSEDSSKVLLDGFPRNLEQLQQFEDKVRRANLCLYLNLSEDEIRRRLLARARDDDTEDVIAKRLEVFRAQTLPVVEALRADGRLAEVPAEGSVEEVFEKVAAVITSLEATAPKQEAAGAEEQQADVAGEQQEQPEQQQLQEEPSGASAAAASTAAGGAAGLLSAHLSRPVSAMPAGGTDALSAQPSQTGSIAGAPAAADTSQGALLSGPSQTSSIGGASATGLDTQTSQAALSGQASQALLSGQVSQAVLSAQASQAALSGPASEAALSGPASQAALLGPASEAALSGQASQAALSAQPSQSGSVSAAPQAQGSQALLSAHASSVDGMPQAQGSEAALQAQASHSSSSHAEALSAPEGSQAVLSAHPSQAMSSRPVSAVPSAQFGAAPLSAQPSDTGSMRPASAALGAMQGVLSAQPSDSGSILAASAAAEPSQGLLSAQASAAHSSRPTSAVAPEAQASQGGLFAQPSDTGSMRPASAALGAMQGVLSAQPSDSGSMRPASAALGAMQGGLSAQPSDSGSMHPASAAPQASQGLLSAQASSNGNHGSDGRPESAASQQAGGSQQFVLQQLKAQLSSIKPPLVICGPSGVGKGTLIGKLMEQYPERFGFSVSHTTRDPRPGEVNGQHYHFSDRSVMEAQVAQGLFLEHADVHGNMYGTSLGAVADVGRQGKMCVLDIDVQGAQQVKHSIMADTALFVFVAPPSEAELERRLRGRGTESEDKVLKRLANAKAEIAKSQEPGFFHAVIVNDDLDTAYYQFRLLIERLAPGTLPEVLSEPPPQPQPAMAAPAADASAQQQQQQAQAQQQDQQAQQQQQLLQQQLLLQQMQQMQLQQQLMQSQGAGAAGTGMGLGAGLPSAAAPTATSAPLQEWDTVTSAPLAAGMLPGMGGAAGMLAAAGMPAAAGMSAGMSAGMVPAGMPSSAGMASAAGMAAAAAGPPTGGPGTATHAFGSLAGMMGSAPAAAHLGGGGRGMPVRAYMDSTVIPVLREGLKALNVARPEDPLQFLADYLVANKRMMQTA